MTTEIINSNNLSEGYEKHYHVFQQIYESFLRVNNELDSIFKKMIFFEYCNNNIIYLFELSNPKSDLCYLCLNFNTYDYIGDIYFVKSYSFIDNSLIYDKTFNDTFSITILDDCSINNDDLHSKIISLLKLLKDTHRLIELKRFYGILLLIIVFLIFINLI
jgi:hypothetical protein